MIRLNFLHELEAIQTQKQRDPLKIAMLAILVVIMIMGGYYMVRLNEVNSLRIRANQTSATWKEREATVQEAEQEMAEMNETIQRVALLNQYIERRFLWAESLALLDHATGPMIQLQSFNGSVGDATAKLTIGGIVADKEPRIAADEYLRTLETTFRTRYPDARATFDVLEEQPGRTVTLPEGDFKTARFSISITVTPTPPKKSTTEPSS